MSDNKLITLHKPTFCKPSIYDTSGGCVDMVNKDTTFSCVVNGNNVDSYLLQILDEDNLSIYTSGTDTKIQNNNSNIGYSGTWVVNQTKMVDDTDSAIQYYGFKWNTYTTNDSSVNFYNHTVHQSGNANDYIQYLFVGTGIEVYMTTGTNKGIFEIFIDNTSYGTIDTYTSNTTGVNGNNFQVKVYNIDNLPLKEHTIKILVTGNKNSSSSDSLIELDYFKILNSEGAKNSNIGGNYFTYNFTTTGINIYMDKTPESGIVEIFIDNVSMGTFDLYSSLYSLNQLVYSNYSLSSGTSHTLKLVVTGNKNNSSTNCYCYFEYLELISANQLTEKLYDKNTFSMVVSKGIVTQLGSLKWKISFWNSLNNNEMVTSDEFLLYNMTTPSLNYSVPSTISSKSYTFDARNDYVQDEKIPPQKYQFKLYAVNYDVDEGYFGQVSSGEGVTIDEGTCIQAKDSNNTIRYRIDEGNR